MGNTRSTEDDTEDVWWNNTVVNAAEEKPPESRSTRQKRLKQEFDEFKVELARKHEKRRELIRDKRKEMQELREEVKRLKQENEALKTMNEDTNDVETATRTKLEMKMTIATMQKDLHDLNTEVSNFERERQDYQAHVVALKDVVSVSKQMLLIREAQLKELREKVKEIEASLAGRELKAFSQDLKDEYERQLQNIRNLRITYEERQRAAKKEKEEMKNVLDETKKELSDEQNKNSELVETLARSEDENSKKYDEIKSLESTLGLTKAECRQYQAELSVINQLFSQILLGFNNSQEIDIEKLIRLLEENHHLLQDIAINEGSNQVSALPKVLLDLVNEVNDTNTTEENEDAPKTSAESQISHQLNSASEIVENLPKVWKVLIELLSHQSAPVNTGEEKNENPCYKMVDSPKGPHLVLSVSQTFIRLKDLILEKKSLERETCRLKHLNTHLECRMQEQGKRLELVSHELSETWHVVGKLQKKHQLLHTQEKILRYELAQKRKLLGELKVELEYSREKWQEAREKNSTTEKQWEQLRIEFASRKNAGTDDSNNSVESGYSDDKECSSEDEPGYETDVSESNQKPELEEQDKVLKAGDVVEETEEHLVEEHKTDTTSGGGDISNESDSLHEVSGGESGNGLSYDLEKTKSVDKMLEAREERLKRLEDQCSDLVKDVKDTTSKSETICNRLDTLHEVYGAQSGTGESSELTEAPPDELYSDSTK